MGNRGMGCYIYYKTALHEIVNKDMRALKINIIWKILLMNITALPTNYELQIIRRKNVEGGGGGNGS